MGAMARRAEQRYPRTSRAIIAFSAYLLLTAGALTCLVPFIWMLSTSLKAPTELFSMPPQWIPAELQWSNYARMAEAMPILRMVFNSSLVTVLVTAGQVFFSSLAGYAFARLKFPGRDTIFLIYLGSLMVPFMVTIVPSYALMRFFGWIDTYYALVVPGLFGTAYGTFLMRQFFMTLPQELEDAAILDGCTPFGTFWRIYVPLIKPALATLAVITVLAVWNDFLWPLLVVQSEEMQTLTVGLASFQGLYGTQYHLLMAGAVVSIMPILVLFLFSQRFFIEGISLSGLK
jgi:multiple sugar transport system permease protein